jgi:hypothetical protein
MHVDNVILLYIKKKSTRDDPIKTHDPRPGPGRSPDKVSKL